MERLMELTPEQESRIPEWVEKWTKIGLSTEPADFDKAIAAAKRAYSLCGLAQPLVILKVGSLYASMVGGGIAHKMLGAGTTKGPKPDAWVSGQVHSQVGNVVRGQVWDMVRDQIEEQVGQARGRTSGKVSRVFSMMVNSVVNSTVWGKVSGQVHDYVARHIGNQSLTSVSSQISTEIWDKVQDEVWRNVGDKVWNHVADTTSPVYNDGISSLWCSHTAYFTFFRDVCGAEIPHNILERIRIGEDLTTSCGGTWWHENILVISDRPKKINLDAEGRLHCENGPSVEYRDGWGTFHWHGVSIPEEWMTTRKPTAEEALTWGNVEQRRVACEIVTWAKILKELDTKTIDEDGDPEIGTLVECSIPDSGRERFLRVLCGTSREFVIPVPREMRTAIEANSWTWGLSPAEYKPEIRT